MRYNGLSKLSDGIINTITDKHTEEKKITGQSAV